MRNYFFNPLKIFFSAEKFFFIFFFSKNIPGSVVRCGRKAIV